MAEKTFFNVQIFELSKKHKLVQGRLHQVKDEDEARRKADMLSTKEAVAGVVAYELTGDPEFDNWGEPRLIAQHGQVPEDLAA